MGTPKIAVERKTEQGFHSGVSNRFKNSNFAYFECAEFWGGGAGVDFVKFCCVAESVKSDNILDRNWAKSKIQLKLLLCGVANTLFATPKMVVMWRSPHLAIPDIRP